MLFSIIVPVYNVKKYLRSCLESIRMQTFTDFEVLVVDDGSTDGSADICDEYAERDCRFIIIHKKNGGLVSARKIGAENVSGQYVLNVDSDDYIESTLLEKLSYQVRSYSADIVAYNYKMVSETGQFIKEVCNLAKPQFYDLDKVDIIKDSFMYDKSIRGQNGGCLIFSVWTKAVKSELYKKCQPLVDDRIQKGEDLMLNLYLIREATSVLICDISGYCYRMQPESMTHISSRGDIDRQKILIDELRKISKESGAYEKQIRMYEFYSSYMMLQRLVTNKTTFREYAKYIKAINDARLFDDLRLDLCANTRVGEKFKVVIIRCRLWSLLFLYFKAHLKI